MTNGVHGSIYHVAKSVTPSDTTLINCNGIYVTDGGGASVNIALSFSGTSTPVTFTGVHTGDILPVKLRQGRIMATNTTASNILIFQ